jgi:hypothetical protein
MHAGNAQNPFQEVQEIVHEALNDEEKHPDNVRSRTRPYPESLLHPIAGFDLPSCSIALSILLYNSSGDSKAMLVAKSVNPFFFGPVRFRVTFGRRAVRKYCSHRKFNRHGSTINI